MMAYITIDRRVDFLSVHTVCIRVTVAVHAPAHCQAFDLADAFHGFDQSVALLALDAHGNVGAVVEVDEAGQIMHLDPADRLGLPVGKRGEIVVDVQSLGLVEFAEIGILTIVSDGPFCYLAT